MRQELLHLLFRLASIADGLAALPQPCSRAAASARASGMQARLCTQPTGKQQAVHSNRRLTVIGHDRGAHADHLVEPVFAYLGHQFSSGGGHQSDTCCRQPRYHTVQPVWGGVQHLGTWRKEG